MYTSRSCSIGNSALHFSIQNPTHDTEKKLTKNKQATFLRPYNTVIKTQLLLLRSRYRGDWVLKNLIDTNFCGIIVTV